MQTNKTLADFFSEHASSSKFIYEIETGKKKNHKLIFRKIKKRPHKATFFEFLSW